MGSAHVTLKNYKSVDVEFEGDLIDLMSLCMKNLDIILI